MKFIFYLLIGLCFLLLWGLTNDLADEVIKLRAMNTVQSAEIRTNRSGVGLNKGNSRMVIDEVRNLFRKKNLIPLGIEGTYLVYETE